MWDDKINKKIKDAADQYHPAYDDNAWDKMELLLNEHLPVKNNERKKYFFLLLLFLLLGVSFFAFYKYHSANNKSSENVSSINIIQTIQPQEKKLYTNQVVKNSSKTNVDFIKRTSFTKHLQNNNKSTSTAGNNFINDKTDDLFATTKEEQHEKDHSRNIANTKAVEGENKNVINNLNEADANGQSDSIQKEKNNPEQIIVSSDGGYSKKQAADVTNDIAKGKDVPKSNIAKSLSAAKKSTTKNNKFSRNFSTDISAGPDVSAAGLDKTGKIAISYGIGLGYNLSARVTLHTGFYIADKIYSANANEYHVPTSAGYNYLFNVDANCKVYELPVTVSYNFEKAKNHQWFVGGGLSSYLMKKESYDYYYKYPSGYVDTKSWSISNKNQHFFAVLDISAGYEYIFNKRVSMIGAPYLKIPMTGVGAGKVKLNSGGILFTLSIKPFYKK